MLLGMMTMVMGPMASRYTRTLAESHRIMDEFMISFDSLLAVTIEAAVFQTPNIGTL